MTALELVPFTAPYHLACAFPPARFLHGASTTIADLDCHGLGRANALFVSSKSGAVRLIVATNYVRANASGHGNRASRRVRALALRKSSLA